MPYIGTIKEAFYYKGDIRPGDSTIKVPLEGVKSLYYTLTRLTFYYDLSPSLAALQAGGLPGTAGGNIAFDPPVIGDARISGRLFLSEEDQIEELFDIVDMGLPTDLNLEIRYWREGRRHLVVKTFQKIIPGSPSTRMLTKQSGIDDGGWEDNYLSFIVAMPPAGKVQDYIDTRVTIIENSQ